MKPRALPVGSCTAACLVWLLGLSALLLSGAAGAALGAHYLGQARDGTEFRVYLHGGEFLGKQGDFHVIRVTVHVSRAGRVRQAVEGCIYRFDELRRERDRLECGPRTAGGLSGAVYEVPAAAEKNAATATTLVCAKGCGPRIPQKLGLEDADEDNG